MRGVLKFQFGTWKNDFLRIVFFDETQARRALQPVFATMGESFSGPGTPFFHVAEPFCDMPLPCNDMVMRHKHIVTTCHDMVMGCKHIVMTGCDMMAGSRHIVECCCDMIAVQNHIVKGCIDMVDCIKYCHYSGVSFVFCKNVLQFA
jgi:hypothetical protein